MLKNVLMPSKRLIYWACRNRGPDGSTCCPKYIKNQKNGAGPTKFLQVGRFSLIAAARHIIQQNIWTIISILSLWNTRVTSKIRDFVEKIRQLSIPPNSFLFTADIDSLYTNIDIKEGIQTIKNIFKKYPDSKRPKKNYSNYWKLIWPEMILNLIIIIFYKLKAQPWARNSPPSTQIFSWLNGRTQPFKLAQISLFIISAIWTTSGESGNTRGRILIFFYRYLTTIRRSN